MKWRDYGDSWRNCCWNRTPKAMSILCSICHWVIPPRRSTPLLSHRWEQCRKECLRSDSGGRSRRVDRNVPSLLYLVEPRTGCSILAKHRPSALWCEVRWHAPIEGDDCAVGQLALDCMSRAIELDQNIDMPQAEIDELRSVLACPRCEVPTATPRGHWVSSSRDDVSAYRRLVADLARLLLSNRRR